MRNMTEIQNTLIEQTKVFQQLFEDIKTSIIFSGVNVPITASPREYPDFILQIEDGVVSMGDMLVFDIVDIRYIPRRYIMSIDQINLKSIHTIRHTDGVNVLYWGYIYPTVREEIDLRAIQTTSVSDVVLIKYLTFEHDVKVKCSILLSELQPIICSDSTRVKYV